MAGETDTKSQGPSATPAAKKARTRSPAYPYLDLRAALDKAGTLWRAEGRHAVAVSLAMQHWGYKAESSTGYSCIAALKKFSLVDEEGTGEGRQVRLSRLALTVLLDEDRASPERNAALQTAALSPRIHAELWEKYGADLPSDSSLRRFLILEKNFNEAAVEEFLEEYKTTVAFAGLRSAADPSAASAPGGDNARAARGNSGPPAALPRVTASQPSSPSAAGRRVSTTASAIPSPAAGRTPPGSPGVLHRKDPPAPARPASPGRKKEDAGAKSPATTEPETGFLFPEVSGGSKTASPAAAGRSARHKDDYAAPPVPADDGSPPAFGAAQPRELSVPLDNDSVVRVPYPMSEEDFDLLIETLHLWKRRLVRPHD